DFGSQFSSGCPLDQLAPLHPVLQEIEKRGLEGLVGHHPVVADAKALASGARGSDVRVKLLEVFAARQLRFKVQVAAGFHVVEQRGLVELELHLGGIEKVEHNYLVPGGREQSKVALEVIDGREQVGDQHHHAAFAHDLGDALKRCGKIRG